MISKTKIAAATISITVNVAVIAGSLASLDHSYLAASIREGAYEHTVDGQPIKCVIANGAARCG